MYCPNCGTGNQTQNFCTNCGSVTNISATSASQPPLPQVPPTPSVSSAPVYPAFDQMANPYMPAAVESKKKIKPVWIIAPVAAIVAIAVLVSLIGNQTAGPLSQYQAESWGDSVSVPSQLLEFDFQSPEDPNDLDSLSYVPKFEFETLDCQAISDLERLGRFMGQGDSGEMVLPDMLQGFDAWAGKRTQLLLDSESDYEYSNFDYGVLSFADDAEAASYVSYLDSAASGCSSLEEIDVDSISYFQDTEDQTVVPGFENSMRLTYTSAFGFTLLDDTTVILTYHEFSIAQIGPNVVFTHAVVSEDAPAQLGVSMEQLTQASDDVFSQSKNLINKAARS